MIRIRPEDLHVLASGDGGDLWHAILYQDGGLVDFIRVDEYAGEIPPIDSVACAGIGSSTSDSIACDNLHVLAIDENGRLWYTVLFKDGHWMEWVNVNDKTGYNRPIESVACAKGISNEMHVCITPLYLL